LACYGRVLPWRTIDHGAAWEDGAPWQEFALKAALGVVPVTLLLAAVALTLVRQHGPKPATRPEPHTHPRVLNDAIVMCDSREQAEAALAQLTVLLADLGLEPKAAKTRIVHLVENGQGLDFLGFHHRLVRRRTPRSAHLTFLGRWPSRRAVQHARDRIRTITGRPRLLLPPGQIVRELNWFLRGWAGYFRYGNSALMLGQIRNYALQRLALWLSKRGNRRRAWGWGMTRVLLAPDHLGLVRLDGTVVPPRPFRAWRG